jgi:hypothetical protein
MSTIKFKAALEARGVEVEMKISPTTGKETPAFAKTDEFMELLQDHADPVVAAMAAARIGLKSRWRRRGRDKLLSIANWTGRPLARGAAASTWRDADPAALRRRAHPSPVGEWGMNMQNMPTVRGSKGKSKLRQSLIVGPTRSW